MAANDGKISGLTRISGLDRANDLFEVDDVSLGASKSATVNDMLGITGAPLGTTDTQSPTNKTFDNTNTITVKDTLFTLQDDGDVTKQARFQLSGITTGTTRTYTLPNASGTLMDLASSQSASNKTFVSPTLTTPLINNPTINTDALSEFTSSNGITVAGLNIKSGKLNTNNSVVTANVTDGSITPAKLITGTGSGWALTSFTPTWTNLAVGNAVQASKYIQTGKWITAIYDLTFGTTTSVSGTIIVSLPVTSVSHGSSSKAGDGLFINTGVAEYPLVSEFASTTTISFLAINAAGTYAVLAASSATIPFSFGTGSRISATVVYEVP